MLRSIDTYPCKSVCLPSTREHTDSLPPLKYLDGLVHLHKPTEPLGLAALRDGILQLQDPVIGQRVKVQMKVVHGIEGRDMEAHPTKGVSHVLTLEEWEALGKSPYLRFSGSTPRPSKIRVPISFIVVTIREIRKQSTE